MENAITSAGTSLAISATLPTAYTQLAYETAAAGAVVIGEITSIGEKGRTYTIVTHNPLATRGTQKGKGSFDDGDSTVSLAIHRADTGQLLAKTALDDDSAYTFVETHQDGSIDYYTGLVSAFPNTVGGVDDIWSGTLTVALESGSLVEVAAS